MLTIRQIFWSLSNAILITAALLYGMQQLIKTDSLELTKAKEYHHVSWVHIPEDPPLKKIKPPIKPDDVELQPQIEPLTFDVDNDVVTEVKVGEFTVDPPKGTVGLYKSPELVLMFASTPVYPQFEIARGIEGYVHVGFSVDKFGRVFDPYIIEAKPKGAFEKSALKAILKFKYKPRYESGEAVETNDLSYLFRFEIAK